MTAPGIAAALTTAENVFGAVDREATTEAHRPLAAGGKRNWMPPADRMPPIVQFALHAARWFKTKVVSGTKEGAQLRLVGQLALGAKRHLALVEVGGVRFLVGGGAEHVTVIVPVPAANGAGTGEEPVS